MKHLLLATACTFALAGASHAASFTFGADAEAFDNPSNQNSANGNEIAIEGTFDQVYNDESSPLFGENVKDGIMVQATATTTDSNGQVVDADPFMDSFSSSKPAGLGVCSTGFDGAVSNIYDGESQCSSHYSGDLTKDSGDDNLVDPEVLKLSFLEEFTFDPLMVVLNELFIRDANHEKVDTQILISDDGTFNPLEDTYEVLAGVVQGLGDFNLGPSTMYWFTSVDQQQEIYLETLVVSEVPLPAGLTLMLAGMGAFGVMARRRKP